VVIAALGSAALAASPAEEAAFPAYLANRIRHVIILYTENRSFDNVYGRFPGARGLDQARPAQVIQTDALGRPLAALPQPYLSDTTIADPRFPPAAARDRFGRPYDDVQAAPPENRALRNGFYDADRFAPLASVSGDMVHRFYTEQYQINRVPDPKNSGGAPMSKFSIWSDNPGLVMGTYDAAGLGEARLAREFVLCDNVFHSAFGGSFLNHFWLVAARTPVWRDFGRRALDPQDPVTATAFDSNGFPTVAHGRLLDRQLTSDSRLEPFPRSNAATGLSPGDYWAVNTFQPQNGPASDDARARLPLQDFDTIGDRMTAGGVSWAYFAGGWDRAKAGHADPLFQYHHQPFAYFRRYALAKAPVEGDAQTGIAGVDSPGSARYLRDERDFVAALANGNLPDVAFVKPLGESSGHPGQSSLVSEQEWVEEMIGRIRASPYWKQTVVFVIPDENGGLWDHVPPPRIDTWGPGTRIPMVIISPLARHGFVDHSQYETVSILRFIELRWNLRPLNRRDAEARAPLAAFEGG